MWCDVKQDDTVNDKVPEANMTFDLYHSPFPFNDIHLWPCPLISNSKSLLGSVLFYDKLIFGMANWLSKDTYGTLAVLARKWATVMGESIIQAHSSCSRPTRVWNLPPYRNIIQKYYSFQHCWWELSVHVHKMLQHYM